MKAIVDEVLTNGADTNKNKNLKSLIQKALNRGVPLNSIKKTIDLVQLGYTILTFDAFDTQFEGEAYLTVSGQNANNSIRLTNEFMQAVENDAL